MYIPADTLDDLLRIVYNKLLRSRNRVTSSKGVNRELSGVLLKINNPRTRLSLTESRSTLFSCLGEFLWYLAGSNKLDFIRYYIPRYEQFSDDDITIHGGYGPRIRGKGANNQVATVINLLKKRLGSRQAVIQLFDANDLLGKHSDVPCTCTLQFLVRNGRLNLITFMRSNDAYWGLPHDVFAFTMLQEIVARSIGVNLGTYKHAVGSLHLYDDKREAAETFLNEGWQSKIPMPDMPREDPWPAIKLVLAAEKTIRKGGTFNLGASRLDPYWKDLIRILQIYRYTNNANEHKKFAGAARGIASKNVYAPFVSRRYSAKITNKAEPQQLNFFMESLNERKDAVRLNDIDQTPR